MPNIIDPVPTGSRAIAVRTGQPLRMVADAASDWYQKTNTGSFTLIGSNVATLVWSTPTSVTRRFTFDTIEIGVVTPGGGAPSSGTLFLNLCEGPATVLQVTGRIRNEAREEPPLHSDMLENDDPPLGLPLAMAGANRDGMGTVLLERAYEAGGAANLVSLYGPAFLESSGKLGVRTTVGKLRGLGVFPQIASYHHGAQYLNYDFGKSRTLSLTRVLQEETSSPHNVSIVRGDGRRNSYRYFNYDSGSGVTYYTPAASLQNTLLKAGSWFQETTPCGTYYLYNAGGSLAGKLERILDRYSNPVYYRYDSNNRLQKIAGASGTSGMVAYLRYDANGLCNALVLEDGADASQNRTTYFQYDANRNLQKITGPELCVTYFEYGSGTPTIEFLTAVTDSLNQKWALGYDSNSRLNKLVDPKGQAAYFDYDTSSPITRWRDRAGKTTYFDYGPHGSPTFVRSVGTPSDYYRYDGDGNLTSTQNRLGKNWYFEYDSKGNRISMKDPLLSKCYFEYSSSSFTLRAFEDQLNRRTYLVHDATRNRSFAIDPLGRTTYYTYKSSGLLETRKDRRGAVTDFLSDAKANLTGVRDPLGFTTYHNYNSAGERAQTIDPLSRNSYFVYDKKGRLTQTNDGLNNTRYFVYDAACNMTIEVDPRDVSTYHTYDANYNRTKTALVLSASDWISTYFRYDQEDRLIGRKDPRLNEAYWTYDSLGRRERQVDPLGFASYLEYDDAHQLQKVRDQRLNTSYMDYDVVGRLQVQKDAYLNKTYFGFDKNGNRVLAEDPRSNKSYFTYNSNDWLTHTTNAILAVTYLGYDEEGNRIFGQDPLFNRSYWSYDLAGRPTHTRDALGNQSYFAYDGARQQIFRLDPLLFPSYFEYDSAGRQVKVKDAFSNFTYMLYDRSSNLLMSVDEEGFATYFAYDNANRRTEVKDAFLVTSTTEFDRASNVTRAVDRRGFATYWEYDSLNRRQKQADPVHFAKAYFGYDAAGNQTLVVDPRGFAAYYTFDLANRLENVMDQGQAFTYHVYDAASNKIEVRVDQGYGRQPWGSSLHGGERRSSYFEYDAINRVRRIIDPPATSGATRGFTYHLYDAANNKTMVVDQEGRPTYFAYDALNRLERTRNGVGDTSYLQYDERSQVTKRRDGEGRTVYLEYDRLGRLFRQGNALGELSYFGFDKRGSQVLLTNPRNYSTYYTFDRLGRVSHQKDALNGIQYFGFDASGNVILTESETNRRTYFSYDGLNRQTKTRDALNKDTYLGYDSRSQVVLREDGDNRRIYYSYDNAGRLLSLEPNTDPWLYYRYDARGNLTIARDDTGTTNLNQYDFLDRLVAKTNYAGTVYYAWDKTGRKSSLKDPDLTENRYVYDAVGRLSAVELADGTARTAYYLYDQAGLLKRRTSPVTAPTAPTLVSYYKYDVAGRLNQLDNRDGGNFSTVRTYFTYERNANGAITHILRELGRHSYYQFDALDRMSFEHVPYAFGLLRFYYTYDADSVNSARSQTVSPGAFEEYFEFNAVKLPRKYHSPPSTTYYYEYDSARRMTALWSEAYADASQREAYYFDYNQRDMVTRHRHEKSSGANTPRYFTYNGLGERVAVAESATSPDKWAHDGSKLLMEKNSAGTTLRRYRHNGGLLVDVYGSTLAFWSSTGGETIPNHDQRGRLVAQTVSGVDQPTERDAQGETLYNGNTTGNRSHFQGRQDVAAGGLNLQAGLLGEIRFVNGNIALGDTSAAQDGPVQWTGEQLNALAGAGAVAQPVLWGVQFPGIANLGLQYIGDIPFAHGAAGELDPYCRDSAGECGSCWSDDPYADWYPECGPLSEEEDWAETLLNVAFGSEFGLWHQDEAACDYEATRAHQEGQRVAARQYENEFKIWSRSGFRRCRPGWGSGDDDQAPDEIRRRMASWSVAVGAMPWSKLVPEGVPWEEIDAVLHISEIEDAARLTSRSWKHGDPVGVALGAASIVVFVVDDALIFLPLGAGEKATITAGRAALRTTRAGRAGEVALGLVRAGEGQPVDIRAFAVRLPERYPGGIPDDVWVFVGHTLEKKRVPTMYLRVAGRMTEVSGEALAAQVQRTLRAPANAEIWMLACKMDIPTLIAIRNATGARIVKGFRKRVFVRPDGLWRYRRGGRGRGSNRLVEWGPMDLSTGCAPPAGF